MNIFEKAARTKLRFETTMGQLTVEQLWDLPLTTRTLGKSSLDGVARAVHSELKSLEEGSFVVVAPDPRKAAMELRLEILKFVIADKMAVKAEQEKAAANAERKQKLLRALSAKEESTLVGMSKEEIEAEIAKLG